MPAVDSFVARLASKFKDCPTGQLVKVKNELGLLRERLAKPADEEGLELVGTLEDLCQAVTDESSRLKEVLLKKYSHKEPKRFIQYDGFVLDGWDDVMKPDEQGHAVMALETFELMEGASIRLLVTPHTEKKDVRRIASKNHELD